MSLYIITFPLQFNCRQFPHCKIHKKNDKKVSNRNFKKFYKLIKFLKLESESEINNVIMNLSEVAFRMTIRNKKTVFYGFAR